MASASFVRIRYWAAARSVAGCAHDDVEVSAPLTLEALRAEAVRRHGRPLEEVLAVCSVLVDDLPVRSAEPGEVLVGPGATVEFLPPFAGG